VSIGIYVSKWTEIHGSDQFRITSSMKAPKGKFVVMLPMAVVDEPKWFDIRKAFDELAKANGYVKKKARTA
jgi:hypothetical protein